MKRLLLVSLLLVGFASMSYAAENPVDQGSIMLSGSVYFSSLSGDLYEVDGDALTTIGVDPTLGYFVVPSVMIGGVVDFANISQGDESMSVVGAGPMVGYFFDMTKAEVKGSIYPYIIGFFTYRSISDDALDEDVSVTSFGGKAGIDYMLSDGIALNAGVKFTSVSSKYGDEDSISGTEIWVGAGLSVFVY